MVSHVLTVCIFCLICATHTPCGSHAAVAHEQPLAYTLHELDPSAIRNTAKEKHKEKDPHNSSVSNLNFSAVNSHRNKRNSGGSDNNKDFFLKELVTIYGDGETISGDNLDKLIAQLQEIQRRSKRPPHNKNTTNTCTDGIGALPKKYANISSATLEEACPSILYNLIGKNCDNSSHGHEAIPNKEDKMRVWLFSIISVLAISACGIISLFIVPVMKKKFYKPLLQFLVALAVGTLAGDALLHLLPHAMSSGHHHDHENDENVWKGFVAMLGLIVFFVMERFIPLIHRCRKTKPANVNRHVKVLSSDLDANQSGDTQCMDRYNASRRCYQDIVDDPHTTYLGAAKANIQKRINGGLSEDHHHHHHHHESHSKEIPAETNQNQTECLNDSIGPNCTEVNKMLPRIERQQENESNDYRVILSEHGAVVHHGHSHVHGHVHAAPENFSSVAWMVIMGDGLHNFTDGMAIGAAFSGGIAGGFSTTLAVLCHELPHEIGDFAMLLKAGMTVKQAFFYNIISSVLCILGNLLGIWLGNTEYASSWVFAVAAGTFIYIALVDMLPELSSAHEDEGNFLQCALHLSGLLLGFALMTLIALYEHDLKNMFVV